MNLSNLIFLDVETTGNGPEDRLCQLAWKKNNESTNEMFSKLYKPPVPISIESMAVHHITEEMVQNRPLFKSSDEYESCKKLIEKEDTVVVAHNAPFDVEMLKKEDITSKRSIDTLKLVRQFDPDMKIARHNLQYLRYFLKIDKDIDTPIQAHDAKSDVIILELIFKRLYIKAKDKFQLELEEDIIDKMIALSNQPAFIGKFAFGKYMGLPVVDVAKRDPQYLQWLLKQKEKPDQFDEDWIFTIKKVLGILH